MNDEWVETTLGQSANITIGRTPPRKEPRYWTKDLSRPFCTIADMDSLLIDPTREGVTETAVAAGKAKMVPAGSLLMSFKLTIGRIGFAARDLYPNEAIAWIRSTDERLDERYLALWLESQDLSVGSGRAVKGATLNGESLRAIAVRFPPLPVQRRIVDLMAHLDNHLANLRAEREAAEGLLAHLRRRLMESSETVSLEELAESTGIQIGPFGSQLHAREYSEMGVPVVMPKNLINGRIEEVGIKRVPVKVAERLSRHLLRPGDIIFPRRGDLSKRALVSEEQDGWLCGTGCIRFRPTAEVDSLLVFETLSGADATDWLIEHAVGTTMLNLNTEIVSKLPVADPRTGSTELSKASRLQAEVCEALRQESAFVRGLRNAVLAGVISGSAEIPESYDSLLSEVA